MIHYKSNFYIFPIVFPIVATFEANKHEPLQNLATVVLMYARAWGVLSLFSILEHVKCVYTG